MSYTSRAQLPKGVKDVLPIHAQDIWKEVYNQALSEYKNPTKLRGDESLEEVAAKVAWSAVKHQYEKVPAGRWIKKIP